MQNDFKLQHTVNKSIIRSYVNYKDTENIRSNNYPPNNLRTVKELFNSNNKITVHELKKQERKIKDDLNGIYQKLIIPSTYLNSAIVNSYKKIFEYKDEIENFCKTEVYDQKRAFLSLCNHINNENLNIEQEFQIKEEVFLKQNINFYKKISLKIKNRKDDFKSNFVNPKYKDYKIEDYKNFIEGYLLPEIIAKYNTNPFRSETLNIEDYEYEFSDFIKNGLGKLTPKERFEILILKGNFILRKLDEHYFNFTYDLESLIAEHKNSKQNISVSPTYNSYNNKP